jgi:hypothetical protein
LKSISWDSPFNGFIVLLQITIPEAADCNPLVHRLSLLRAADVLNDLPAALHTLLQQAADQLTGSTPFYSWNKNIFFAKILYFVEFPLRNYFSIQNLKEFGKGFSVFSWISFPRPPENPH